MQPIIDAHHHLWQLGEKINYPWLEDKIDKDFFLGDYGLIRKNFSVDDLQKMIPKKYHLMGSVHCEAEANRKDAIAEAFWIDSLCQNNQLPCAQSVWVDLSAKKVGFYLERIKKIHSVKGVRWKPATYKNTQEKKAKLYTLLDKTWQSALAIMADLNLIWELRVPAWHLFEAAECLSNYPELKVIVNHCGLPWDRTNRGIDSWYNGMKLLAENQNVAVKLSELGTPPNRSREEHKNKQLIIKIIKLFGRKRCLFASNMPVSGLQISYKEWIDTVELAIQDVCSEYKDDIFWRNAMRWYEIKKEDIKLNNI